MNLGQMLQDPAMRALRESRGLINPPSRCPESTDPVALDGIEIDLRRWRAETAAARREREPR